MYCVCARVSLYEDMKFILYLIIKEDEFYIFALNYFRLKLIK